MSQFLLACYFAAFPEILYRELDSALDEDEEKFKFQTLSGCKETQQRKIHAEYEYKSRIWWVHIK